MSICHVRSRTTATIPAFIIHPMLISQYVAFMPTSSELQSSNASYISVIFNLQPQVFLEHREVVRIGISVRVQVSTESLKQQVWPVTQEGVPIMAQVKLPVLPPCVDFVDADEFSMTRIPKQKMADQFLNVKEAHKRLV